MARCGEMNGRPDSEAALEARSSGESAPALPRRRFPAHAEASRARTLSGIAAFAALVLLAGCVTPISPAPRVVATGLAPPQLGREESNLRVFDAAWTTVDRRYYDPRFHGVDWRAAALKYGPEATVAPNNTALYKAINAMLGLLDDGHTGALAPRLARDYRAQQVVVTGFRLRRVEKRWAVEEVMPGGPAEAAGVQPGWIVLSRNGQALGEPLDLPSMRTGEVVHWEFLDGKGRRIALSLTAGLVSTARTEARLLPGGALYLRFDDFDWGKMRWLSRQLKKHRSAPAAVIDLRHNPGGMVLSLGFMLGEFFDRSFRYAERIDRSGHTRNLKVRMFGSAHYRGKVAVLVDHFSASAAEIFAATMQERHRGIVIGHKTAGYVLFARLHSLPGGGMLECSEYDLRTEDGTRLEGRGVTPDIVPPRATLNDLREGVDPDIDAALRIFRQP
jgi:carboxyl-terminal processing protease